MITELKAEQLRNRFDPTSFDFATTESVAPTAGIIGQPRAVEALAFGVEIDDPTFHVYVAGPPGTGRTSAVEVYLRELAGEESAPSDWCYVNNFADSSRPRSLELEPGQGREFTADVEQLVTRAREEVPKAFETEEYSTRRREIDTELEREREELYKKLEELASGQDFLVQTGPVGIMLTPVIQGRKLTEELARALSPEFRRELLEKQEKLQEAVNETLKQVRAAERRAQGKLEKLNREVVLFLVGGLVDDLIEKYRGNGRAELFLEEVRESLVAERALFKRPGEEEAPVAMSIPWIEELPLRRYEVNLFVDRTDHAGAPVIIELNPTYPNLFGRIEKESRLGAVTTDFTLLKAGALHHANGGYLVVPVRELVLNYLSYESLKRALRNREVEMEEPAERLGLTTTRTVVPEPIPLDVKVVLIGTPLLYHLLYLLDEDFKELFKVKAHFDDRMARESEKVSDYVAFISALCTKEELPHLDRVAVGLVLDEGSRLAEDQTKLTTRFADVADLIREAAHTARRRQSDVVEAKDVKAAIDARIRRSNLVEERIREMIDRGQLRVDTEGEVVGQVNGISIIDLGDYSFGRPSRITASMSLGQAGVVDIEREAKLGGPIHTKGVMILSGYLGDRFARDYPLSLTARLVFEQSYAEVEGDSASGAELLAVMSALSGAPALQGVAVTGSIDQQGRVQAVGGVNEKVEGFYDVCRIKGLTGDQGILIPAANIEQLMLREDVAEAVEAGDFHVWAVDVVEDAVELLFGISAGDRGPDDIYPEGSVFRLVDDRLRQMAETLSRFARPDQELPEASEEEDGTSTPG